MGLSPHCRNTGLVMSGISLNDDARVMLSGGGTPAPNAMAKVSAWLASPRADPPILPILLDGACGVGVRKEFPPLRGEPGHHGAAMVDT
jgi:hypothetical protein